MAECNRKERGNILVCHNGRRLLLFTGCTCMHVKLSSLFVYAPRALNGPQQRHLRWPRTPDELLRDFIYRICTSPRERNIACANHLTEVERLCPVPGGDYADTFAWRECGVHMICGPSYSSSFYSTQELPVRGLRVWAI
jgi:hypothetical protein